METAIFFDIDGTLRDIHTAVIPDSTKRTLKRLREKGYLLGIATGRPFAEVEEDVTGLIDWDIFVCSNGQAVLSKGSEILFELYFPDEAVEQCVAVSERTGLPIQLVPHGGEPYLTSAPNDRVREAYGLFGLEAPHMGKYRGEKISAVMTFGEYDDDARDYGAIEGLSLCPGVGVYTDITMSGVSKFTGILTAMEYLGVSEYCAFGDALNDFDMLSNAKLSVAMGAAPPELIKAAKFHTSALLEDGIERACVELALI